MRTKQEFAFLLSPLSWFFFTLAFLPLLYVLFRPSMIELGLFLTVDYIALWIFVLTERRGFVALYPGSVDFFPTVRHENLALYTRAQHLKLFEEMIRFPARRSGYCALAGGLKALPALLVIIYAWKNDSTHTAQAARAVAVFLLVYTYFYGAAFLELHGLVSAQIAALHARYHWEDVFRLGKFGRSPHDFDWNERLVLGAIWIFTVASQVLVLAAGGLIDVRYLVLESAVITFSGTLLFARTWYLGRQYFITALRGLFGSLETFEPEQKYEAVPLHSSPILAQFEKTFNSLIDRLQSYEKELSSWILARTEQSRFRAIGEISALVVHDLSSPMHVLQFCVESLKEHPDLIHNPKYLDQLTQSTNRSLELIESWKAYLKNSRATNVGIPYAEAYGHLHRLLSTQYAMRGFSDIALQSDPRLNAVSIKMTRAEFIHVLMNILSNSIENLLGNQIVEPKIDIQLQALTETEAQIMIRDNGTGLSVQRFEQLTAFIFLPAKNETGREGLGLRLIRRLVERSGGKLNVLEPENGQPGTTLSLTLPVVVAGQEEKAKNEIREANLDIGR